MKLKYIYILALFIGLGFSSCREDQEEIIDENPMYEPEVKVEASVFGVVSDDNQDPVEDALVTFDGKTTTTDIHGVFRFENESLFEDGTYITVKKDGYFQGSRRFYPKLGKESRVGIELMPLTIIDQIESTTSAKVKFENVELDFEANSVVTESGAPYNGTINIAARYLDPTKISTLNQMPGDLSGYTTEAEVVSLTSLGMIGVELMDDNGNELQLKEGAPVSAIIPIPAELLSNAPSTIPLWHFDETVGIWVEEGEATKVGDHYEALLPHFSFWNCDYPGELVCVSGSIFSRGIPASGMQVIVYASLGVAGSGYTDENGFFIGKIPANEELTFELVNACGDVIYSITIGPFTEDTVLEPINVNNFIDMVNISGSVASCDDEGLSNLTYVVINVGDIQTIVNIEDDNTFSAVTMYCSSTDEIDVYAYDPFSGMSSVLSSYTIDGDIEVGELTLCEEELIQQYVYKYGDNIVALTGNFNQELGIYSSYELQVFTDKTIFTFTLIDWNSNESAMSTFTYKAGEPIQNVEMGIINEEFSANGQGSSQFVEQNGNEFYVFKGILDVLQNNDGSAYTGEYTEVEYSIVVPQ